MAYEGMIAETMAINGNNNEPISAYVARPLGPWPFRGMVLIHHAPGSRVAVEITLESAKALSASHSRAIAAAEEAESTRLKGT